jgi:pimeloyl-ACP methyl ester carboxylesterase
MSGKQGRTLAIDDGGRGGLPVVFLHSLAGNSSHWARQLEHLRSSRRALAPDLRGHGRSKALGSSDYSIAGMGDDVAAALDHLRIERLLLVGHSLGGGVALEYAGAHPDRVVALLLVDSIGDGTQIPAAETKSFLAGLESNYESTIQGYWTSIAGPDSAVRQRLLNDLRATPRKAVVQLLRDVMKYDPHPALRRYQGPKQAIVTPANDAPFSLHRLGGGFPHQVVTGTGHWIQLDKPDQFNRLLDEFLVKT